MDICHAWQDVFSQDSGRFLQHGCLTNSRPAWDLSNLTLQVMHPSPPFLTAHSTGLDWIFTSCQGRQHGTRARPGPDGPEEESLLELATPTGEGGQGRWPGEGARPGSAGPEEESLLAIAAPTGEHVTRGLQQMHGQDVAKLANMRIHLCLEK